MENKLTPGQDDDLLFQFRSKPVSEEKRTQNWKSIEKGIEKKNCWRAADEGCFSLFC